MDLIEYQRGVRTRHPWEIARAHFFARWLDLRGPCKVLDIGSGDAWLSQQLLIQAPHWQITGWDSGYTPELIDELQQTPRLTLTATRPKQTYDGILLLDVLEHIEHDGEFLSTLVQQCLKSGGWALISVPAWPFLFSDHDRRLKHFRRYRADEIRSCIEKAGLRVVRPGYLFRLPFLLRLIENRLNRPNAAVEQWSAGGFKTRVVVGILKFDSFLFSFLERLGLRVPGLSWWALCQKP